MSLESVLTRGAESLGIALPQEAVGRFRTYYDLLDKRSKEFNLTAIKGEDEAATLHFLDSIGVLTVYDFTDKSIIDIGTGAGFPGLPLAIAEPTVSATLVDSTEKKVDFLREVSEAVGLDTNCIHGRAEELAAGDLRQSCDVAVSRAVARLDMLCELCMPFVKVGGAFVALKSSDSDQEITEAAGAIATLGGAPAKIAEYKLPGTDITRRAVIIEKVSDTPAKYPRRYAKIQKSPLK